MRSKSSHGARVGKGAIVLGACLALAGLGGCVVSSSSEPVPVESTGRLTLRWTIDGTTDPNLCVMGQVMDIDITISTTGGALAGEFRAPCEAFATTVSTLLPGSYVASARLVVADVPRTTPVDIAPFTIFSNSELVVDVDFPANSFE